MRTQYQIVAWAIVALFIWKDAQAIKQHPFGLSCNIDRTKNSKKWSSSAYRNSPFLYAKHLLSSHKYGSKSTMITLEKPELTSNTSFLYLLTLRRYKRRSTELSCIDSPNQTAWKWPRVYLGHSSLRRNYAFRHHLKPNPILAGIPRPSNQPL